MRRWSDVTCISPRLPDLSQLDGRLDGQVDRKLISSTAIMEASSEPVSFLSPHCPSVSCCPARTLMPRASWLVGFPGPPSRESPARTPTPAFGAEP